MLYMIICTAPLSPESTHILYRLGFSDATPHHAPTLGGGAAADRVHRRTWARAVAATKILVVRQFVQNRTYNLNIQNRRKHRHRLTNT